MKAWCPHGVRWFRWCAACAGPEDFVDVQELIDATCMPVWREQGAVAFITNSVARMTDQVLVDKGVSGRDLLRPCDE